MRRTPLVGLPSDRKQIGHHPFQAVGEKYIRAVVDGAGCLPVLVPSLAPPLDLRALLADLDGLLLTGAYSNIEPHHYGNEPSYPGNLHDPARDIRHRVNPALPKRYVQDLTIRIQVVDDRFSAKYARDGPGTRSLQRRKAKDEEVFDLRGGSPCGCRGGGAGRLLERQRQRRFNRWWR